MDTVLVYRERLLPPSETFVAGQARALLDHRPVFAGIARDPRGAELLGDVETLLLEDVTARPRLWRELQRLAGLVHPAWLEQLAAANASLMHAHFGVDAVWAMPIAELLDLPMVVTFHGWDYAICRGALLTDGGPHYPLYARRRPTLFERAASVVAVSEYAAEQLRRLGCPPAKIRVHHVGVDVEAFGSPARGRREPMVLFVGRLIEQKGCEHLLRAMATVQASHPDAELVVVGDGPRRATLQRMAQERGIHHRFTGAIAPDEVRALLARAAVFCVPSKRRACGCGESFGLAFAEAQAAGVPVVAFRQGGVVEAVEHGVTGLLVEEGDEAALAGALASLLGDERARAEMGAAGRRRVEQRFDLRTQTAALEGTYDEVAHDRRSSLRRG